QRRPFHDYFVTHLPTSSLHPDSRSAGAAPRGPHHKLPRDASTPDQPPAGTPGSLSGPSRSSPAASPAVGRDTTVVRIPLRSAKHHFGACVSRGTRAYNEDAHQAGTIEVPAFAKRPPISLTTEGRMRAPDGARGEHKEGEGEGMSADSAVGDPQVFYFGVFDGHGGTECSDFLSQELHEYIEEGVRQFELKSTLKGERERGWRGNQDKADAAAAATAAQAAGAAPGTVPGAVPSWELAEKGRKSLASVDIKKKEGEQLKPRTGKDESGTAVPTGLDETKMATPGTQSVKQSDNKRKAEELERKLVRSWRELVGGYFKRFKPEYFALSAGGRGHTLEKEMVSQQMSSSSPSLSSPGQNGIGIETVLTWAFLKADLDFVSAQAGKKDAEDPVLADRALNDDEILGRLSVPAPSPQRALRDQQGSHIGGAQRFRGGSTASVALVSTPTPTPFWHPASWCTVVVAHVGDTRVLLCRTRDGEPVPLTTNHHTSTPAEATRLRRYAAAFATDSFGEERIHGLANTRAFGDMSSKRVGVSAEPEIRRVECGPAEYAFLVLVSDGVSGELSDKEIVDVVKEARTPEKASRDVVAFATEVGAGNADNATALVVRMGGWERRSEGGVGSLGTREMREWRRREAEDPRASR
ncbi:phosphatase 2C-like domain-containing protein, partial [Lineolata rhizophorae]